MFPLFVVMGFSWGIFRGVGRAPLWELPLFDETDVLRVELCLVLLMALLVLVLLLLVFTVGILRLESQPRRDPFEPSLYFSSRRPFRRSSPGIIISTWRESVTSWPIQPLKSPSKDVSSELSLALRSEGCVLSVLPLVFKTPVELFPESEIGPSRELGQWDFIWFVRWSFLCEMNNKPNQHHKLNLHNRYETLDVSLTLNCLEQQLQEKGRRLLLWQLWMCLAKW
jgi:hypothetical protein